MAVIRQRPLTATEQGAVRQVPGTFLKLKTVLIACTLLSMFLLFEGSIKDLGGATSKSPSISDRAFFFKNEGPPRSNRPLTSRKSRVLAALPTGDSDQDILRVSKAVHTWSKVIHVDWVFFHYKPRFKWVRQDWYNETVVLSVEEKGFLYGYFYKYLVTDYINNLDSYD